MQEGKNAEKERELFMPVVRGSAALRRFDPPEEEAVPDCPVCGAALSYYDRVYCCAGRVVGCESCIEWVEAANVAAQLCLDNVSRFLWEGK